MVASGFFVSRASHGKAGALSMVGRSSFSRVIPGGATVFRATSARNIAHTGRRRSPARASGADFRVSMQGGNISSLAKTPDAEIGGACLAAKDLFNVTSFRGSPPFLSSLLSSHRALPAPLASRHLARLWSDVSRLHPRRPRLRFKFFRAPDFALPGSSFPRRGWRFAVCGRVSRRLPFRRAFPLWEPFSPRRSFPLWSASPPGDGVSNLGSAPRAKKKAAVLCGNGGLFPVGWRTTGTFWD